jgi:hypothetical protein
MFLMIHTVFHLAPWGQQGNPNLLIDHFSGIAGLIIIIPCLLICIPMTELYYEVLLFFIAGDMGYTKLASITNFLSKCMLMHTWASKSKFLAPWVSRSLPHQNKEQRLIAIGLSKIPMDIMAVLLRSKSIQLWYRLYKRLLKKP